MKNSMKLFIHGGSPRSRQARNVLESLETDGIAADCEFTVVDVEEAPQEADAVGILATPALVIECQRGARRVVGDLSGLDPVLCELGLIRTMGCA